MLAASGQIQHDRNDKLLKKPESCNRQSEDFEAALLLGLVGRHVKVLKRTKWQLVSVATNICC